MLYGSILRSTRSGYEFYYLQDILKRCCVFELNGEEVDGLELLNVENTPDGWVVKPTCIMDIGLKLYSQVIQKYDGPDEWFTDMFVKMFWFTGLPENFQFTTIIKEPLPDTIHIKTFISNLKIECEIPNISKIFEKCEIRGFVNSSVYDKSFLYKNKVCSYFGKEYMGF